MLIENLKDKKPSENYEHAMNRGYGNSELKKQFQKNGFLQYQALEVDIESKISISREFKVLEKDPFAPTNTQRFRRYGNALILPWEKEIKPIWLPTTEREDGTQLSGYDQGDNNPEHGSIRYFNALSDNVKQTKYLNQLIVEDYDLTFGLNEYYLPIYVGVHFVKLTSSSSQHLGISSPNCFHQDGEPFTFAHLFYRSNNIIGGENFIAHPSERNKRLSDVNVGNIYSQFTLKNISDSFAVHDPSVCHYVSPIQKINSIELDLPGERWMILIDYSLTKQKI
ncbi:2OG-Fe dioxygenase family protein [Acinetobacter sp. NIPH 2699]|uniref:2OG-Fe dioxygenase family protein n=1 Tax=Acinetobacter sp. NIPH 2699 TaxID=2923433 RepID=UPI001F4B817A|nr:2OG-Fe dioxygenase family protein [Acinetobacter sp. NIPH 2699]MCH7335199.1 2OG-Fe dioxygenase family protein [Acinetobacter sp. NIPH 2699]